MQRTRQAPARLIAIQTRYQNTFVIQPAKGTYYWDCVGFVDWALRQATPQAESAMRTTMKIAPGYVPTPTQPASYLTGSPSTTWQQLSSVTQLSGGEIMVIPGAFTSGSSTYAGTPWSSADPPFRCRTARTRCSSTTRRRCPAGVTQTKDVSLGD